MPDSQWHKFYSATVAAPPEVVFELLSDMPHYQRWLPESEHTHTTEVDPARGTRGDRRQVVDVKLPMIVSPHLSRYLARMLNC